MAYKIKRNLAVKLRKEGKSYSQIKKIVKVSKSTLSYWLSKYPLTKKQIYKLQAVSPIRIEKFREAIYQIDNQTIIIFFLSLLKF